MRDFSLPRECLACHGRFPSWAAAVKHFREVHRYLLDSGHLADEWLITLPDEVPPLASQEGTPPFKCAYCSLEERDYYQMSHLDTHLATRHFHVYVAPPAYGVDYVDADLVARRESERLRRIRAAGDRFVLSLQSVSTVGDFLLDCGDSGPREDDVQGDAWRK